VAIKLSHLRSAILPVGRFKDRETPDVGGAFSPYGKPGGRFRMIRPVPYLGRE